MEEKKTKKMTKAEAFEYLKGKKVYVAGKSGEIQEVLFKAGFSWDKGFTSQKIESTDAPFLYTGNEWSLQYGSNMENFIHDSNEEISAEDILSIEIVEEDKETFVDCSEPCPEIKAVQGLLRNSKYLKDKTLVITKDNAAIL